MTLGDQLEISRSIYREANDAFFILRPADLRILDVNPAAQRLTGRRRKQLLTMSLEDLVETRGADAITQLIQACQTTSYFVGTDEYLLKGDKGDRAIQLSASRIHTEPETLALLVVRDVSRQKALEEQLHHSQRMEAIGRLSSGIAHEFNNLLTIINGYSDELMESGIENPKALVEEIQKAGKRAASFTRQLLDFGSKQRLATQVLDLDEVVTGVQKMLRPLLGDGIEVVTRHASGSLRFEADPARIEQLIINLAANARDAMPSGGRLTIETFHTESNRSDVADEPAIREEAHIGLRVTDTGCGMDPKTVSRAFEPFFSTKERNEGTGLGLAMVYSAVTQSRGSITVESQPGEGSTFTIHFPATDKELSKPEVLSKSSTVLPTGSEHILLVDDDESIRGLVQRVLEKAGYTVILAQHGADALATSDRHPGRIHLVLTDYLMPGMQGDELARRLREKRPEIRVICMSGCAIPQSDAFEGAEELTHLGEFLQKPFSTGELTQRVRDVLDA